MERYQTNLLFITSVEREGPFLKIWGQPDKNVALYLEQVLMNTALQFDNGLGSPTEDTLQIGVLCCAKYKDNKYYRARITSLAYLLNRYVEVNFIDYGNRDVVPVTNVRSLDGFDTSFISIPPQAGSYILAEAVCPRGEWSDSILEEIANELRYTEVAVSVVAQVTKHFLVKIYRGQSDVTSLLISRGFMRHTSLTTQEAVLLSLVPRMMQPAVNVVPQQQPQALASYKAFTLEPGNQYSVYVSYVTDGPCNFSIQLKQSEEVLCKLMKDINSMNLTPLDGIPIPGTICLGRCMEDGHICRAVVTNEVDGQYKIFYVDFGNFETVSLECLFEIPFKYVIPKVMSIRFALAGVEKTTVTLEMQCAFKQFVDNRLIYMKVMPVTSKTSLPRCELWDPETNMTALEVVNQAAVEAYPDHIALNRGFTQPVKVSYVFSCKRFFVQLKSKEDELTNLMLNIQTVCEEYDPIDVEQLKVGLPCYAMFEGDQQWYRSQIAEIIDLEKVKVHYVDYGNEEIVPIVALKAIDARHLTVLRPQAIECCLNGYQNMPADPEIDNLLEELILEQEFTMKVVEMCGGRALVELIDQQNYNVASLLLEKIATSRSQVSPMLVQAGNKIEHRKLKEPVQQSQNRPEYTQNRPDNRKQHQEQNWRETSEEEGWRDDGQNVRNKNESESNDVNENSSWRQNNKGFDKRNKRENDSNAYNESGDNNWKSNYKNSSRQNDIDNRKSSSPRDSDNNYRRNRNRSRDNSEGGWNNRRHTSNSHDLSGENADAESGWDNGTDNTFKESRKKYSNRDEEDGGFKKPSSSNTWNNRDGGSKPDYNKRRDGGGDYKAKNYNSERKTNFRREGSEISSSGSEKGWQNESKPYNKRNDTSRRNHYKKASSPPALDTVPNPAATSDKFNNQNIANIEATIIISWFHNPSHFYCQLIDSQEQFKQLMVDIQQAYRSRQPTSAEIGAPIIGLFPDDEVLYRATVLEIVEGRYKVYYVDFGNVSVIDKVWPIEKRFMALPAQAICCSLEGVKPPAEHWVDANNYATYFDKKEFLCQFKDNVNDRVQVKLLHDGQDIAQQLIDSGLAQGIASSPVVEIAFLVGQRFRASILSVNSISDFVVCTQSGMVFTCALFGAENAAEDSDDAMKEKLEQIFIVWVKAFDEDKLVVNLYGDDGIKVKLTDYEDEVEDETIEFICPYLVLNSTLSAYVTFSDNSIVYVQPLDCTDILNTLLDHMFDHYDSTTLESPLIPEQGSVYAAKGTDDNWYRARVVDIDDEKASVHYIDYGNSEDLEFAALRQLDFEFSQIQILCLAVNLNDVDALQYLDKNVNIKLELDQSGFKGTIIDELAVSHTIEDADKVAPETAETVQIIGIPIILSHVDSPSDFYVQLLDSSDSINELQSNLQNEAPAMPDLENPTIGVLCAAPYSGDQQWYRAQVLDLDADITTVRFVDYGNTDVLDNNVTRVKTLPPTLLQLEVHATRCRLKIKPVEEEWSSAASERFDKLVNVEHLTAEFVDQDEKTNYIELYSNGENVTDILIGENLALADDALQESKSIGFVSHLNSPSEFWIQLENCIDELEWVAEQLSGGESFSELEDLAPGALCAALFPDDQMWYRARILSNTIAGIEVLFIDYGNSCTCCGLRELPEELVMQPPLAQKCSLQKPKTLTNWGPEMARKFSEISAEGQTTFTVRKISTGETALVELLLNGEDVATMLMPITEDVQVKNFSSLDDLILVKEGEELPQTWKLEALPDVTWNQESLLKFAELNDEGKTVFQAEFVSDDTVRLYINLNDIRLELSGSKKPSLNSTPIKMRSESKEVIAFINSLIEETIDVIVEADESRKLSHNATPEKGDSESEQLSPEEYLNEDVAEVCPQSPEKPLDESSPLPENGSPEKTSNEAGDGAKSSLNSAPTKMDLKSNEEMLDEPFNEDEVTKILPEKLSEDFINAETSASASSSPTKVSPRSEGKTPQFDNSIPTTPIKPPANELELVDSNKSTPTKTATECHENSASSTPTKERKMEREIEGGETPEKLYDEQKPSAVDSTSNKADSEQESPEKSSNGDSELADIQTTSSQKSTPTKRTSKVEGNQNSVNSTPTKVRPQSEEGTPEKLFNEQKSSAVDDSTSNKADSEQESPEKSSNGDAELADIQTTDSQKSTPTKRTSEVEDNQNSVNSTPTKVCPQSGEGTPEESFDEQNASLTVIQIRPGSKQESPDQSFNTDIELADSNKPASTKISSELGNDHNSVNSTPTKVRAQSENKTPEKPKSGQESPEKSSSKDADLPEDISVTSTPTNIRPESQDDQSDESNNSSSLNDPENNEPTVNSLLSEIEKDIKHEVRAPPTDSFPNISDNLDAVTGVSKLESKTEAIQQAQNSDVCDIKTNNVENVPGLKQDDAKM